MVELVEVSPRDGLQNEPVSLSVDTKVALIERAIAAGARRLEVASLVRPDAVPQMTGAEEVIAKLRPGGVPCARLKRKLMRLASYVSPAILSACGTSARPVNIP